MCVPVPPESQIRKVVRCEFKLDALPATIIVMAIAILALNSVSSYITCYDGTHPRLQPRSTAVPPTARLSLQSQPAGAIVTVDGAERGRPCWSSNRWRRGATT